MKILAIATQKGGVGKTTSSLEISMALALEHDKRVLLIDIDQQCNMSKNLNQTNPKKTIYDVLHDPKSVKDAIIQFEDIDFIPGSPALSKADIEFNKPDDLFLLDDAFDTLQEDYDFIILDCGPQRNKIYELVCVVADYVVAPCDNTEFGSDGLISVFDDIEKLKKAKIPLSRAVVIGAIITKFKAKTKVDRAAKDILENVMKQINPKGFVMVASDCVVASEAKYARQSMQQYAPYSTVSLDYKAITKAILDYIKNEEVA